MFQDRHHAGKLLAEELKRLGYDGKNTIVLAIPRGGVVVGRIVADELSAAIDVIIAKKLGAPAQPELAIGSVGPGGSKEINWDLVKRFGIDESYIRAQSEILHKQIEKREQKFREGKPPLDVGGKTTLVVDDGIATGATIESALLYLRQKNPKKLVAAIPVAPPDSYEQLVPLADEIVILYTPEDFCAVGQFYREFPQVTDEEVVQLLNK